MKKIIIVTLAALLLSLSIFLFTVNHDWTDYNLQKNINDAREAANMSKIDLSECKLEYTRFDVPYYTEYTEDYSIIASPEGWEVLIYENNEVISNEGMFYGRRSNEGE